MVSKRKCDKACKLAAALTALAGLPGCILMQNRYSVFGFNAFETTSAERAQALSVAMLAVVAVASAVLGVVGYRFVQRRLGQRNASAQVGPVPAHDHNPDATKAPVG